MPDAEAGAVLYRRKKLVYFLLWTLLNAIVSGFGEQSYLPFYCLLKDDSEPNMNKPTINIVTGIFWWQILELLFANVVLLLRNVIIIKARFL